MTRNLLSEVVANGWCKGCGMCAAICPMGRLDMKFNEKGEYNPVEVEGATKCSKNCKLCYQVCPAHGNTLNETEIGRHLYGNIEGIKHSVETGYYLSSYLGYSNINGHRANGSSGGLATWTLEKLLDTGIVDAVVCVGRTENPEKFFEFKICKSSKDIRQCSRSAYYPVEISQVIKYILKNKGRYAIIGLPCVCKSIRLAQSKYPQLQKRIKLVLGLVCGRSASKYFVEYLVGLDGGDPHNINNFNFRVKKSEMPAKSTFGLCSYSAGELDKRKEGYVSFSSEWSDGYFKPKGCFYCDDIFAECSDAVFLDAWLDPYSNSPKGHNIIIVRSSLVDDIYTAASTEVVLSTLDIHSVIRSQQRVVFLKRYRISEYFRNAKINRKKTPKVRKLIIKSIHNPIQKKIDDTIIEIAYRSSILWYKVDKNIHQFEKEMKPYTKRLHYYQILLRILSKDFPSLVIKKLITMFKKIL